MRQLSAVLIRSTLSSSHLIVNLFYCLLFELCFPYSLYLFIQSYTKCIFLVSQSFLSIFCAHCSHSLFVVILLLFYSLLPSYHFVKLSSHASIPGLLSIFSVSIFRLIICSVCHAICIGSISLFCLPSYSNNIILSLVCRVL